MNEQALQQAIRWSDYYRTSYLPILQKAVDRLVGEGMVQLADVHRLYEYMDVPEYLWIYTANLSQLTEVYDIVRLDVVGLSCAKFLGRMLRRYRRLI